ncbi:mandelate racemase/muconate lactonizing enzyme family protein [Streptomyces aidingensis]|uniref:L-alanine-DL-glutamate epimerase n=1 Tax=Streptomyces aidingensis TaxID=910347 RepID=A0A1I1UYK2_9ACTN|nr:enolase C-terminal domain-like protein [Streptomyces aidingensis]SFD75902.1 L-alanine-DL-glutamate epimerase [Streptomyces aidingensis]
MRLTTRTTVLRLATPLRISRSVMTHRDAVCVAVFPDDAPPPGQPRTPGRGAAAAGTGSAGRSVPGGAPTAPPGTVEETAADEAVGYGEVVSSRYLGVATRQAVRLLREQAAPALARHAGPDTALEALRAGELLPAPCPPSVAAAVDAALLDLLGKLTGQPVYRLLADAAFPAVRPPAARTARTIGITGVAEAVAQARELAGRGFAVLKLKAGTADPEEDLRRVAAVRDAVPSAVQLLLDPNGAWTPSRAAALLPRFADLGVAAVEQPTAPGDPEALARLAERSPVPLIADEDAAGLADARRLAGRVQGVNIKLAKCGGVQQALRICAALAGSGTGVMLGCLTASSLSLAPAVHLADRARWADLDGHLLLAHDPWQGIGGADGTVRASERPGLGVRPASEDASAAPPPSGPSHPSASPAPSAPESGPECGPRCGPEPATAAARSGRSTA